MDKKTFIITKKDTGYSHSWKITDFDVDIVIPYENKTYQYIIAAKSEFEDQIIVTRILEEFFQEHITDCNIQILGIQLSRQMKNFLELLSPENTITINSKRD